MDEMAAEQISQAFVACGHSVALINGIIDGSQMVDTESREALGDKASIAATIAAGEAYVA